jgi:hypothetical protein
LNAAQPRPGASKGGFSFARTAGLDSLRFTGRVNGKALAPGSYQLQALAKNSAGTSKLSSVSFKIVR